MEVWVIGWFQNGVQRHKVFDTEQECIQFSMTMPNVIFVTAKIWRML